MGRAVSRTQITVEGDERFCSVLGSRRGAARSYDALLAGQPRRRARAEAALLIAALQNGQAADAVAVLTQASGHSNLYLLEIVDELAAVYAEHGSARWQHTAAAALHVFKLDATTAPDQHPQLDEAAGASWKSERYARLQTEITLRLQEGGSISAQWLQDRADATCRTGLLYAIAGQCKRAPDRYLEALLGDQLEALRDAWPDGERRSTSAVAAAFSIDDWVEAAGPWVAAHPMTAAEVASDRQPETEVRGREAFTDYLADEFQAAILTVSSFAEVSTS